MMVVLGSCEGVLACIMVGVSSYVEDVVGLVMRGVGSCVGGGDYLGV